MKNLKLLLLLSFLTTLPTWAQVDSLTLAQPVETSRSVTDFRPKQLIAPAALIALGTWGLAENSPIDLLGQKARDNINKDWNTCKFDNAIQYVPSAVHALLGLTGVKSKHNFRDRLIASATAHVLMVGVTRGVKHFVDEQRPDSDGKKSFFSGHTATVFTGAELMRIEYGWGYGSAAYAVAATTAFMRVYNKRHWVGDVLAGAGVGILCADAGYWMLPVWKRLFRIDQKKKESKPLMVAAPFYLQDEKAAGLSCSLFL